MAWEILLVRRRPRADERGYTVMTRPHRSPWDSARWSSQPRWRRCSWASLLFFSQFAVLDAGAGLTSDSWMIRIATWIGLFVLVDFCYYWFHRVHHG